jgi:hypothetical protein
VVALARENAQANRRYLQRAASPLPSGRDAYRRLADFENELKELAKANPGLVRPITLKNKTVEDRDVNGVEITTNVNDLGDGKPVFFNMGIHHAREWPSGEHAMEFAYDLVKNFGKDPRITGLVEKTRTIVVPVINPDGFNVSREAPIAIDQAGPAVRHEQRPDPRPGELGIGGLDLGYTAAILGDPAGAYKRKNCRLVDNQKQPQPICRAPQFRQFGTDPNRNYGGLWGGAARASSRARDLPRRRAVLGVRDPERPRPRLQAPGHDADHEPHLLEPRPAPAGRARPGARRRTSPCTPTSVAG